MSEVNTCPDYSCFDDIIGLSETHCACYPDNNYETSVSCLYLDQAEGMNLRMIEALEDCGTSDDLWTLMDTARTKAVKRFVSDMQGRMAMKYALKRSMFTGYIGKNAHKYLRTLNYTYAGLRLRTAQVVGGYLRITHINTLFEATGTINLSVYNSLNELLYSVALDTTAGVMDENVLATPMELPLWDGRTDNLDYVFIYTYSAANQPYDTKVSCCGRTYHFNCEYPYFNRKSNKMESWAEWVMAGSVESNDLDFSDLACSTNDLTNGLQLYGQLYCDSTKQFCFDTPSIHDINFMSTAFAVYHAAAQYLAIDLITSDKINRYTMINIEQMEAVRQLHESKYQELLTWLTDNADLRNTDCFTCKDRYPLRRTTL